MKPTPQQRAQVTRWVAKWKPRLFLQVYHIEIEFEREPDPTDEENPVSITNHFPYLSALIHVRPIFWTESATIQEHAIRHELAHLITAPLANCAESLHNGRHVTRADISNREETLTDWIARIAFAAHDKKGKS